jgi:hypothetical protein
MTEAEKRRLEELEDLKWVLSDTRGMRVLKRIIERTGLFRTSFAGEYPNTTAFNEGQRNIGLFLLDELLTADAEKAAQLLKQGKK